MSVPDLTTLLAEHQRYQADFQQKSKAALDTYFQQLFVDHPMIEAVRWTQYTPYFNDGEPCVFEVNDPEFKFDTSIGEPDPAELESTDGFVSPDAMWGLVVESEEETPYGAGLKGTYLRRTYKTGPDGQFLHTWHAPYTQELHDRCKAIAQTLMSPTLEPLFRQTYGDHAQVTITRTGAEVEEYDDHD